MNKIILGTVQLGQEYGINNRTGKPNKEVAYSILDIAYENDLKLLDTAEAYGNSQEIIGQYSLDSNKKFDIVTKFSKNRADLSDNISKRILQNLKTLNVDYLYGYLFHSYADFEKYYFNYKQEISQLKKSGIIKKLGVSIYTNEEFEKLLMIDEIDIVQLPFNILDNSSQHSEHILRAKEKGIEIHARSVFLQGLLFKEHRELPLKLKALEPYLNEMINISQSENVSLNTLALNYVVQERNIDYVLFGTETADQIKENIESLQTKLSQEAIDQINSVFVKETELLNPSNWNK